MGTVDVVQEASAVAVALRHTTAMVLNMPPVVDPRQRSWIEELQVQLVFVRDRAAQLVDVVEAHEVLRRRNLNGRDA